MDVHDLMRVYILEEDKGHVDTHTHIHAHVSVCLCFCPIIYIIPILMHESVCMCITEIQF